MQNYLVKVETETNKIVEVIKFDGGLEALMDEGNKRNQSCGDEFRYLPMPHCKSEPQIGVNASDCLRDKVGLPPEADMHRHEVDVDTAIKLLLSTQMTIKGTHIVPLPGVSAEEALGALQLVIMMLMSLKMMQERHREMQAEKKDAISDLFKKLGLKGE